MVKNYQKQRYLFFWLTIIVYFVPYIIATACLLPMMKTVEAGQKAAIGIVLILLNALPFVSGILKNLFSHIPFINLLAIIFVFIGMFFTLNIFRDYVYTFLTIELVAALSSIVACVLWCLHVKYVRQAKTVKTVLKSGLLNP